jgi:hypothetical protein
MQDGTIKMESRVGDGTSCEISIDYIIESKIEVVSTEPLFMIWEENYSSGRDNAMNQMVIKMITKKWLNTTVLYANNGQEG